MSKKDTTQQGVSATDEETISKLNAGKPPSDRELHLNEIAENAKKARQQEHEEMNIPGEIQKALESNSEGEVEDIKAEEVELNKEVELEKKAVEEPEKVLVKINGVERLALKSEVDAEGGVVAYQKARAADEKMRQAAEIRRQNEEREKAIAAREAEIAKREQELLKNPNSKPSEDALGIEARAKALTSKLYSGDEAEAEEAIKEILAERAQSTTHESKEIDTSTVVDQVTNQVHWELERKQAKEEFKSKYAVIDSNPEYRKYANQMTNDLMKEHPDWGPQEIIMEAGEMAMAKFKDQIREKQIAAEEEERLKNKRATDNVSGVDAKVTPKPAPKPKTQQQIIADMQALRSHSSV